MDIARTLERKNGRRILYAALILIAVVGATVAFARLKPAAPTVEAASLVIATVERGPMTRSIRGTGVLVPENVRWIAAVTDARVERVVVQPGTSVTADTVLVELSDPQQQQSAQDAEWQLRAATAALEAARAELESERLDREAAAARLRAEHEQARLRAKADADLEKAGLSAKITGQLSASTADSLGHQLRLEKQRLATLRDSQRARLAGLQAEVEQRRAMHALQQQRLASLQVRAGIDGVLQQVTVQAGQRVNAGTTIARVAQPDRLKAEIRVAETQAKDLVPGQRAQLDTRTAVVPARVTRIDPAASNGTVLVDLAIEGPLPAGARPDVSVDATIELERLPEAVYVDRPVRAQENAPGKVFRVDGNGSRATRIDVQFGRTSATSIEIRRGLAPGDRVIVSDDTAYDQFDEIKIQ